MSGCCVRIQLFLEHPKEEAEILGQILLIFEYYGELEAI